MTVRKLSSPAYWSAVHYTPVIGVPYRPVLSPPSRIKSLKRGWADCYVAPALFDGVDPPRSLHPADVLTITRPSSTPMTSTTRPLLSFAVSPAPGPGIPEPGPERTPTPAPVTRICDSDSPRKHPTKLIDPSPIGFGPRFDSTYVPATSHLSFDKPRHHYLVPGHAEVGISVGDNLRGQTPTSETSSIFGLSAILKDPTERNSSADPTPLDSLEATLEKASMYQKPDVHSGTKISSEKQQAAHTQRPHETPGSQIVSTIPTPLDILRVPLPGEAISDDTTLRRMSDNVPVEYPASTADSLCYSEPPNSQGLIFLERPHTKGDERADLVPPPQQDSVALQEQPGLENAKAPDSQSGSITCPTNRSSAAKTNHTSETANLRRWKDGICQRNIKRFHFLLSPWIRHK